MSALDDAIRAHMAHAAGSGADPLTDSIAQQCDCECYTTPAPQQQAQHPPLRAGWESEPIEVPGTMRLFILAAALTLLACLLPACGGGDCDPDVDEACRAAITPPDCKARPELCR